ncbi:STAS domain-containing protein [Kitasatospora sp. NPDC048722]|uniref:STAS domain-containing protein n=1 Tax=Kitasatospora sp. NPDC048722 TaxID=3155639 RepID=UPI0033E501B6
MDPAQDSAPEPARPYSDPHTGIEAPPPGLRIVRPAGDLDRDTAPALRLQLLHTIEQDGVDTVVIDCSKVRFCDSSGLNAILRARLIAVETGVDLRLAALPPQLSRLLAVTGADGVLSVDETPVATGDPSMRAADSMQSTDGSGDHKE